LEDAIRAGIRLDSAEGLMLDVVKKDPITAKRDSLQALPDRFDSDTTSPEDDYPRVYWLDRDTVAIDWFGQVTEDKCRYALVQLDALTREHKPTLFFSDTSLATGYVPTIRRGAAEILMHLRRAGVVEMAAVFNSPSIRMFATAVAFVTGLKLRPFEQREEALRLIATRHCWEN
jgi:hypothetical protein